MRQQQSDSGKKPSRFCKFLLILMGFKLCLLAVVLVEPFAPISSIIPFVQKFVSLNAPALDTETAAVPVARGEPPQTPPTQGADLPTPKTAPVCIAFAATAEPQAKNATPAAKVVDPNQPGNVTLDALNRKQEELARREQDLKALEQELDSRLMQMQALEQRLQTMLRDAEETKGEKYKHLVDVLSNMKSRQAAEVLETLDEKIAVRVLAGMRGRQAGEILTYATPAKAARLTEALARMQLPLE